MLDLIGVELGEYRINSLLGAGGMGAVYKAYDPTVNRFVAVKVMQQHFSQDPDFRQRFDQEAMVIARVEHPHILPIYAYGDQDGLLYLVMRYVPSSLDDRIRAEGPLPLAEASRLLTQIASALDYAHERGILHRDLKSENVLLDEKGHAYLADFGLSKLMAASSRLSGNMLIGTPAFMSPEQAAGEEDLTPATDQYSLGICLYHMLTGRVPFDGRTALAVVQMQIIATAPDPRTYRPDLPELAVQVIEKTLAKHPTDRFENCEAVAKAFDNAIEGSGLARLRTGRIPSSLRSRIDDALARVQTEQTEEGPATGESPENDKAEPRT